MGLAEAATPLGRPDAGPRGGRDRRRGPDRRHGLRRPQPGRTPAARRWSWSSTTTPCPSRRTSARSARTSRGCARSPPCTVCGVTSSGGYSAFPDRRDGCTRGGAAQGRGQGGHRAGDAVRRAGLHLHRRGGRSRHRRAAGAPAPRPVHPRTGAACTCGRSRGRATRPAEASRSGSTASHPSPWPRARRSAGPRQGHHLHRGIRARRREPWPLGTSAWWASRPPCRQGPGLDLLEEAFPRPFLSTWASPKGTPWASPPGLAAAGLRPIVAALLHLRCSGPTTS